MRQGLQASGWLAGLARGCKISCLAKASPRMQNIGKDLGGPGPQLEFPVSIFLLFLLIFVALSVPLSSNPITLNVSAGCCQLELIFAEGLAVFCTGACNILQKGLQDIRQGLHHDVADQGPTLIM